MVAVHTLNLSPRAALRDSASQQSASQQSASQQSASQQSASQVEEVKRVPPATDGESSSRAVQRRSARGSHSHSHPCSCHEVPHDKIKDRVRVPWPCGRGCAGQACLWWFPHGAKKNEDGSDAGSSSSSSTYYICTKY
ncbi:hypothetical protein L207DRAFT_534981 [Hyaloscypha variabilis F]|uniref:Uncharacterized protein n=1 Tax=Hyaloscypha variabilis (strain UAMH 11265 / GT02V1 / F) TaxID=1149755 RepID=A0A2J6R5C3_HYAVF|nr:hypothetical protein L207DRAFT_534981 [Hyaloscypha variabilis F]